MFISALLLQKFRVYLNHLHILFILTYGEAIILSSLYSTQVPLVPEMMHGGEPKVFLHPRSSFTRGLPSPEVFLHPRSSHLCCLTFLYTAGCPSSSSHLDIPKMIIIIVSSKNGRWIILFKEFSRLRVNFLLIFSL